MNTQIKIIPGLVIITCLLCMAVFPLTGQTTMPEILDTGTLEEQYDYLEERTRIYNDFRAIREDMFQKIKSNSMDSLMAAKTEILHLEGQLGERSTTIETLQADLRKSNQDRELAVKNRDRLKFLGIPMHKTLYNSILWTVVAALAFLTVILFLSTKRNITISRRTGKDLEETMEEFEAHRKQARERYEQLVVKHHNELRKMKGK